MNVSIDQIKAIRSLISKKDKEHIAEQLGNSVRTIEAVLNCDRTNDEIEKALFKVAKLRHAHLSRVLAAVENQNQIKIGLEDLRAIKSSPSWANDEYYQRYNDIYIRLCGYDYNLDELWTEFNTNHKDIIARSYYCCDLMIRLCLVDEKTAVDFYNCKI